MARTPDTSTRLPVAPLSQNSAGQGLLLATLALLALGVVMVNSAMARPVGREVAWYSRTDVRHTMYALVSVLVIFTAWRIPYRWLDGKRFPWPAALLLAAALACAGLLHVVPSLGRAEAGYIRWFKLIHVGSFELTFQPSELVKFALIFFLAAWLGRPGVNPRSFFKTFLPAVVLIGVAVGAVITQNFSTGAIVGMSAFIALLLAGVPSYYLLALIPPAAAGFYKLVYLEQYRWQRMVAWLDVYGDNPRAYQARESLLGILTGGWTGKGLGMGTVKNGFLPEGGSDFIFSVYCEEVGFIGAVLLIGLILVWMWHARKAAMRAADRFGYLLAGSLGFMLAMQAVLHVAINLAAAPTTGVVLPFVSYGGTSLVISAAAVAMIISVSARGRAEGGYITEMAEAPAAGGA
ncbi:MAG: FtsW/RodA/SpoVE family cell cycle protein [Phycisphaerae bacterium]